MSCELWLYAYMHFITMEVSAYESLFLCHRDDGGPLEAWGDHREVHREAKDVCEDSSQFISDSLFQAFPSTVSKLYLLLLTGYLYSHGSPDLQAAVLALSAARYPVGPWFPVEMTRGTTSLIHLWMYPVKMSRSVVRKQWRRMMSDWSAERVIGCSRFSLRLWARSSRTEACSDLTKAGRGRGL